MRHVFLVISKCLRSTTVSVSWTDAASNETGFVLQRATDGIFTQNVTHFALGTNASTFKDQSAVASTTYYYRLMAAGNGGISAASAIATATTPAGGGGGGQSTVT
jgi:hypothetical protein